MTAAVLALLALGGVVATIGAMFASFGALERTVVLAVLALLTILLAALVRLLWRHARGQFGMAIELHPDAVVLRLPKDRSLVHRPGAVERRIDAQEIARVLSREEAFAAQWMAMLQRTYWLELRNDERILLFEERALQTNYASASLRTVAETIARHLGLALEPLPMVEGRGGLLGAWWTLAPADDAATISPRRRMLISRRIAITGAAAAIALTAVLLAMLLH
ncbi:MAG: hypothetical protein R3E83_07725 [Burkholderiaceae bacterium]